MPRSELSGKTIEQLRLKTQPFKAPDECEELFRYTAADMLINSVIQQLSTSNQVHLIIGERHIGKSCFCRRLICEAPPPLAISHYKALQHHRVDDLFGSMLDDPQNNGPADDTHEIAARAARHIFRRLRHGHQPVLLVDDAHFLTAPVLRMLFRFVKAIGMQQLGVMKVVLVGERKLQDNWHDLGQAAPADEAVYTSLLRPLARQDIEAFLTFRFTLAGAAAQPLSTKQLQTVQQQSAGLPGKIEQLTCDLLDNRSPILRRLPGTKILIAGSVTAVIMAVAAAMMTGIYPFSQNKTPDMVRVARLAPSEPVDNKRQIALSAGNTENNADHYANSTDNVNSADEPLLVEQPDNPASNSTANVEETRVNADMEKPPIAVDEKNQDGTNMEEQPVVTKPTDDSNGDNTQAVIPDGISMDNTDTVNLTPRDSEWLKQWPDDYYVIQLAGSWQSGKLLQLAESLHLEKDLIYHTTLRNNKPWHILLYGVFPDSDSARVAIENLPAEIQATQPWARPIGSVLGR